MTAINGLRSDVSFKEWRREHDALPSQRAFSSFQGGRSFSAKVLSVLEVIGKGVAGALLCLLGLAIGGGFIAATVFLFTPTFGTILIPAVLLLPALINLVMLIAGLGVHIWTSI